MCFVIKLLVELRIVEVNICNSVCIDNTLCLVKSELVGANSELLELHNVLRQCACLVTEDVVDHAELLVEV